MTWCYDYVVFETFPVSRTHIDCCFETVYVIKKYFGERLSSEHIFEIGLVSELVPWYSGETWPVGTGNSLFQPLHCYGTQWTRWPRALLWGASVDHRLVCLTKVSEAVKALLFYTKHEISKEPTSKVFFKSDFTLCTSFFFFQQHLVSCKVSIKTRQLSLRVPSNCRNSADTQREPQMFLGLDSYVFKLPMAVRHWVWLS